jgi:hypothetical protein
MIRGALVYKEYRDNMRTNEYTNRFQEMIKVYREGWKRILSL